MRKTDSKNQIWYNEQGENIQIGFTQSFLDSLEQCWHIMPATQDRFRLKAPLLTIETNEHLFSILSPVAGRFVRIDPKAQNFPDKLKEADVVLELTTRPGEAVRRREEVPPGLIRPDPVRRAGAFVFDHVADMEHLEAQIAAAPANWIGQAPRAPARPR